MATPKFETTQVSGTGYQGYVQQPIADKSGALEAQADAQALVMGGTTLKNAYNLFDDYNKSSVLQGIAGQVEDLYKEQQDRSLAGQQALAQDVLVSQDNLDQSLKGAGYAGDYPLSLNTELDQQSRKVIEGIATKTERLTNARIQGGMDEIELERRLNALTREELARNPAYANEIITHVSKVSNLYGLTQEVKYDQALVDAMQKDAQANMKEIRTELKERDIPTPTKPNGDIDYDRAKILITEEREAKLETDTLKRMRDEEGAIFTGQVNQLIKSGAHTRAKNQAVRVFRSELVSQLKNNTSTDPQVIARTLMQNAKLDFQDLVSDLGLPLNNVDIKGMVDSYQTEVEFVANTLVDMETGQYKKENTENVKSILENEQTAKLLEKYSNAKELEWVFGIVNKSNLSAFQFPEVRAILENGLLKYAQGNKNKSSFLPNEAGEPVAKQHLDTVTEAAVKTKDQYTIDRMKDGINSHLEILEGNDLTPEEAFSVTSNFIKGLATPESKAAMQFIKEPDTIGAMLQQVDNYKEVLNNNLEMYFRDNPNIEINPQFLGNGALVMGNAPRELNGRIIGRINEAFDAYVNITGKSPKEAQEEFYSSFTSLNRAPTETPTETPNAPVKKTSAAEVLPTLAQVESGNRHLDESGNLIKSSKGAVGKYQIMPDTARDPGFGVKPLQNDSEKEHKRFAQDYLNALVKEFGDLDKALAAYNAGPTTVKKAIEEDSNNWLVRLPAETQDYVAKILNA